MGQPTGIRSTLPAVTSGLGLPLRLAACLTGLALAATACGDNSSETVAADPGSPPSSSASASGVPRVGAIEQFVKVSNYGVGFGLPKEWVTVEAKDNPHSPLVKLAARRSDMAPGQFVRMLSRDLIQTMSVAGKVPGEIGADNVQVAGLTGESLSDDQIKQRLESLGAKFGPLRHSTTSVGDVTVVSYSYVRDRALLYGQLLVVDLDDATVVIFVTSVNPMRTYTIEEQVKRTLQPL